jgi:hypothetical protein
MNANDISPTLGRSNGKPAEITNSRAKKACFGNMRAITEDFIRELSLILAPITMKRHPHMYVRPCFACINH